MKTLIKNTHPSWHTSLTTALLEVDGDYLDHLTQSTAWLPGNDKMLAAFSLPMPNVRYVLFGESPYPRAASANGYAFWDASVGPIWSNTGLSKDVNRATSLRNLIKMLLVADEKLSNRLTQPAIAALDKTDYIQTLDQLFQNFLSQGILLLNASLVLSDMNKNKEAKYWHGFIDSILSSLAPQQPQLILLGKIAEKIQDMPAAQPMKQFIAPHPYNLSFIHDPQVLSFFKPFHLLSLDNTLGFTDSK